MESIPKKDRSAAHLVVIIIVRGVEILVILIVVHFISLAFGFLRGLGKVNGLAARATPRSDDVFRGDGLEVVVFVVLLYGFWLACRVHIVRAIHDRSHQPIWIERTGSPYHRQPV